MNFYISKKKHNIIFISEQEFIEKYGEPPWDFVNNILEKAELDFRIDNPDIKDIQNNKSYQPKLIQQTSNAKINFSDLSSGEKNINFICSLSLLCRR